MKLLEQKNAIITGASRGIGLGIAKTFAAHGANLILCAKTPDSLEEIKTQLENHYAIQAESYYFDVGQPQEVKAFYQQINRNYQQLDILVNNAGIMENAMLGMVSAEHIEKLFQTNTYSIFYLSQYASRLMARHKKGSIINVSSIIGVQGYPGQSAYAASKAAIIGLSNSLAKELAANGIRVNTIAPGLIETDLLNKLSAEHFAAVLNSIKLGRIGSVEDVGNAALFLASDLSLYITGQILGVDGGMSL